MAEDAPAARRQVLFGLTALAGAGAGAAASALASGQPAPPPAGSVPVPPSGAIDPRAYGARIDATRDDSDALRAVARTGRPVLLDGRLRIDQVVDLPPDVVILGAGVHRAGLVIGPQGRLRIAGEAYGRRAGGAILRDLTIEPSEAGRREPGVEARHVDHLLFDNVSFYRIGLLLDDHHYLAFRTCRFFGDANRATLVSNCDSQPRGHVAISEALTVTGCFFSSFPVLLDDTVDAHFTDCRFMAGAIGIRSRRRLARGNDAEPFFFGPSASGCVFDSIDGAAIDIEGGGTDCRLVGNFFSAGRSAGTPGVRLSGSRGVELIGNRFEWCGAAGLALEGGSRIGVIGNSFANIAAGPAILARSCGEVRAIGNAFANQARWGGSGAGGTTLAIDGDAGCRGWIVTGNSASGLRDPAVCRLGDGLVRDNPGFPPASEQGWPAGPSVARPAGVRDGYRWYDATLGLWLHWHAGSGRWRDAAGRAV